MSPPDPRLPPRGHPDAPKYWMHEVSGKLAEAVYLYLTHPESLGPTAIGLLRAYFRQWIDSPAWDLNPARNEADISKLNALRISAPLIRSLGDVNAWMRLAVEQGLDPL